MMLMRQAVDKAVALLGPRGSIVVATMVVARGSELVTVQSYGVGRSVPEKSSWEPVAWGPSLEVALERASETLTRKETL